MPTETILCAAIWVDDGYENVHQPTETGIVFGGWRHHAINEQINLAVGRGQFQQFRQNGSLTQGFLTSAGRFVDRREAWVLARAAGQTASTNPELKSEDLY